MVTVDDVRALPITLPRSTEAFVRGRVKFRVGRIVYLAFSRDGTVMGFAFPKEWRNALVESEPEVMEEFDLPAAYEALARAQLVAGDLTEARRYRELGVAETAKIAGEEDRRIMETDFATIRV